MSLGKKTKTIDKALFLEKGTRLWIFAVRFKERTAEGGGEFW